MPIGFPEAATAMAEFGCYLYKVGSRSTFRDNVKWQKRVSFEQGCANLQESIRTQISKGSSILRNKHRYAWMCAVN